MQNNTTSPLVSVVVPVYNVKDYLEECFTSIKNQSYDNIEIIIVDDGSTDGSSRLCDTLALTDDRSKVIHKKNGGLSDARNAGIKSAKGKYITFIDSDDAITPSYISELVAIAENSKSTIVQCDNSRKKEKLGQGSGRIEHLAGKDAFVHLMKFKTISPTAWGKLYLTSLFIENKIFFPVGRIHEDTAILYKLVYLADKISCLEKNLYYYRLNDNSIMTSQYTEKHYDSVVKYHNELSNFIKANKITIDNKIICRHEALRILSILNKFALRNTEENTTQLEFRKRYKELVYPSKSALVTIGLIPVFTPSIFRLLSSTMPLVRRIIGKV